MSEARKNLDWERMFAFSVDPAHARARRAASMPRDEKLCTMCGEFCAMKRIGDVLGVTRKGSGADLKVW